MVTWDGYLGWLPGMVTWDGYLGVDQYSLRPEMTMGDLTMGDLTMGDLTHVADIISFWWFPPHGHPMFIGPADQPPPEPSSKPG